ncbi:importin subunit alpha-2 [Trifolium repens]|nr:importin subunit alpha-2 [Trifolium repens]
MLRNASWTLSNFCRGKPQPTFELVKPMLPVFQLLIWSIEPEAVIEAGLIAPLVSLLQNAEFEIKKEAAWAITNATSGGIHEQIKYLVGRGCIKPLCDLLVCPDSRISTRIRRDWIENLQYHDSAEIYERAVKLLETFWLEDEMILPSGVDDQFGFKDSVPSGGFNFN